MHPVEQAVLASIRRHQMIKPGQRLIVAVSGGADSVCLLRILLQLQGELGVQLSVAHLNHLSRGADSDADEAFVQALAEQHGLPFRVKRADIAALTADEGNWEQAARLARRAFFEELTAGGTGKVATAHTLNDQAETVLYRFLRGSGTAGLAGIWPWWRTSQIRPLLGVTRTQITTYLEEIEQLWREDASNLDLRFDRNRIRHHTLPQLTDEWNVRLTETLARTAEVARDEEEYFTGVVRALWPEMVQSQPDGQHYVISTTQLSGLHPALARRLVRDLIERVKGDRRQISAEHIEAIRALPLEKHGHARVQVPGVDVIRSFDWLRFGPIEPGKGEDRYFSIPVTMPETVEWPGGGTRISLNLLDLAQADDGDRLTHEVAGGPLVLRNWQPGDALQCSGEAAPVRLKLRFQDARIPLWERRWWPVLEFAGTIVWTRQFGVAAGYEAGQGQRQVVVIQEDRR